MNINEKQAALDAQIKNMRKITNYQIREYTIEILVNKFLNGLEDDVAELFIPDYQREFRWSDMQQSRFIESLLLDLPIPYIFVADTMPDETNIEQDDFARLEIVDGSQRIRTLVSFVKNELKLEQLDKLTEANGLRFEDLSIASKRRFLRKSLRVIELTQEADEEARREIFARLNSGGTKLTEMEIRFGRNDGAFLNFISRMARNSLFRELCPVSKAREIKREYEELALRYFAYVKNYTKFEHRVDEFLDEFIKEQENGFDETSLETEFLSMLEFIHREFEFGFKKNETNRSVPRIRFEALSVGATLALRIDPNLKCISLDWLNSDEFKFYTRSDASNLRSKVISRIEYVRDQILGK